jgi:hypothetical protein
MQRSINCNQAFHVEERSQIKHANQDEFSTGFFNQCSDYSSKDLELLLQELKIADPESSIDEDEEFKDRDWLLRRLIDFELNDNSQDDSHDKDHGLEPRES